MPFRLNEAPQIVLNELDGNQVKRGFGMFCSVVFCLPSCGLTVLEPAMVEEEDRNHSFFLTETEEVSLKAIRCALKDLILSPAIVIGDALEPAINEQVERTLKLLQKALAFEKSELTPSYRKALQKAYDRINHIEEKRLLEKEKLFMSRVTFLKN